MLAGRLGIEEEMEAGGGGIRVAVKAKVEDVEFRGDRDDGLGGGFE